MSDELILKLTELVLLVEKWNKHEFDNEQLFLDELKPVAKKVCEELNIEKDDSKPE